MGKSIICRFQMRLLRQSRICPSKPGSDMFSVAYAASLLFRYYVNLLYTSMKVSITYCASSSVITEFMGRVS